MRLRTALEELSAAHVVCPDERLLDRKVVPCPGGIASVVEGGRSSSDIEDEDAHLLVLVEESAVDEAKGMLDTGFPGLVLVRCEDAIPERLTAPSARVIPFTSDFSQRDTWEAFCDLPRRDALLGIRRDRVFKAFKTSYDLQTFAQKLFEILQNPLLIINTDRRLLATAGEFPDNRPDVLEEIEQGYISEPVIASMEAEGILEQVRGSRHSIITENADYGQRWVTSIVYNHHYEMGRFDLLELDRPLGEMDLELVDFAGTLIGLMIDRLGMAGESAGSGSSALSDLINGAFVNEKTMRAQIALAGIPLDETYVLVSIACVDPARMNQARVGHRVMHAMHNCVWAVADDLVMVLVAIGRNESFGYDAYLRAERRLLKNKAFVSTLDNDDLRAYVSEPFEELSLATERFAQCQGLMDANVEPDVRAVTFFWRHRYSVIASMAHSFGELDALVDKRVVAMALYDRDHGTQYLETAVSSIQYPGSPGDAAKALCVHRNTYFYRVNKISELFYLDLKTGDDRLAVAFSARIFEGMGEKILLGASAEFTPARNEVG